ncbi:elongation of very long chain fatty acids protein 4-like [Physella acuta]|uniref:elongation of very long chain fatty acids protein 4-like n=1 Tax=Physella acuta TaxID=109671 RepID=UPI0027DE8796|nr:elongation of very long chain fatty acids protein 4-like [Physella acuta]
MMASLQSLKAFYNETMAYADPRCDGYPLLDSPDKMLALIGLYLFVVWQGPKWMVPYKPWDLKNTIIVYNFAMVILSSVISIGSIIGIVKAGGYSIFCDGMDKYQFSEDSGFVSSCSSNVLWGSIEHFNVAVGYVNVGWLFFISKLIEFLDTIFFVLRKKNNQITFLHVYHHATMTVFTWLGVKFLPGGTNIIYPLINSFIHAVMYTYYALAAFGPEMRKYLWWKKYLTKMQISQFVIFLSQGVLNAIYECPFSKAFVYAVFIYTFTILLLFINFYVRAYIMSPKPVSAAKNGHHVKNGDAVKNGKAVKNGETVKNGESNLNGSVKKLN